MEKETLEHLKVLFTGKIRIKQNELKIAGIGSQSTIIKRRNNNELDLIPKWRKEGRIYWFMLKDVADFLDGVSSALDMRED